MTTATADRPLARFAALHRALRDQGMPAGGTWRRFAAQAAVLSPLPPDETAFRLLRSAEELTAAPWYSALNTPLRFVVAAHLVEADIAAEEFLAELDSDHALLRGLGQRFGGGYETIAVLILRLHAGRRSVDPGQVLGVRQLYAELKRAHWWLTGPEDLPACALLAPLLGTPEAVAARVEANWRALRALAFPLGDNLQTAAALLALVDRPPADAVQRFAALVEACSAQGLALPTGAYPAVALLARLDHPVAAVAAHWRSVRDALAGDLMAPWSVADLDLAADLACLDHLRPPPAGAEPAAAAALARRRREFQAASLALLDAAAQGDVWPLPRTVD